MGPEIHHDPYHVNTIRGTMTRSLPAVFPEVRDEVVNAIKDVIPPTTATGSSLSILRTTHCFSQDG